MRVSDRFVRDVASALQRLANWHQCPDVQITQATPDSFAPLLRAALANHTKEMEAA